MANEVYGRGQSERMDENRTCDCAYANHQWVQDRELMILRHLSTTSIRPTTDQDALGLRRIAFGPPSPEQVVQVVAEYTGQSNHAAGQFRSNKVCFLAPIGRWRVSSRF